MLNDMRRIRAEALRFIHERASGRIGEYHYSSTGAANLYSSCYALMTRHYLGDLNLAAKDKAAWIDYINSWQAPDGGYLGPELRSQLPEGVLHDLEHLTMHLTTTVLPCLDLLGGQPRYPLSFAYRFLEPKVLNDWLESRNWKDAWLEGNNFLFLLQLLLYLRDVERKPAAGRALEQVFLWLDTNVDPNTGLWGTRDGSSCNFVAMCGGYHQLLAYYFTRRPLNFPKALVDTTLALQHEDGGFAPQGGGGACEDVDAVDILVNLYKRHDYRRPEIRFSLRKAFRLVKRQQMEDGGFVYRRNEEFMHMGMPLTRTPPNVSNMFATWFRIHTIALISEILLSGGTRKAGWFFNHALSMGWHDTTLSGFPVGSGFFARMQELACIDPRSLFRSAVGYRNARLLLSLSQTARRHLRRILG